MLKHTHISDSKFARSRKLKLLIDRGDIKFGGNKNLKIYGRLDCKSGKRMKTENRVFFSSEQDALDNHYRPCGNCMPEDYKKWKAKTLSSYRETTP